MTAVLVLSLCAVARKPGKYAFVVNRQTIRPKKNLGGRNGRLKGADEVQRISSMIDGYEADIRAGAYAPDEGWHQFKDHSGLLGDLLRAKGLI